MKTVKRHARIGEEIIITARDKTEGRYNNGDRFVVWDHNEESERVYVQCGYSNYVIFDEEYEVIIEEDE